jgi:hypothetical protein
MKSMTKAKALGGSILSMQHNDFSDGLCNIIFVPSIYRSLGLVRSLVLGFIMCSFRRLFDCEMNTVSFGNRT